MVSGVSFLQCSHEKKPTEWLAGMLIRCISLLMLTGCFFEKVSPQCVNADDWGEVVNSTININPKNQYTDSGISVVAGNPLTIVESGQIDLCPSDKTIGQGKSYTPEGGTPRTILQTTKGWQDSGIEVKAGDKLNITISGSYNDRKGLQTNGSGLYAYIAPAGMSLPNGDWWYGVESTSGMGENRLAMDPNGSCHPRPSDSTKCNNFFELYDNGTTGPGGSGYSGFVPETGRLYFRYARTADSRSMSDSGDVDQRHSPWKGAYRWIDDACAACMQVTIHGTCFAAAILTMPFFSIAYPTCLATWEGSCKGKNQFEYAVSDWQNYKRSNCQEFYPSGSEYRTFDYWGSDGKDHWVDENYSGSAGSSSSNEEKYNDPNAPGYLITVSSGCTGIYGKYMNMIIGEPQTDLSPAKDANGAFKLDATGSQIYIPTRDFSGTYGANANPHNMDSSATNPDGTPILPTGFTKVGTYDVSSSPASGRLWFQIIDNSANSQNTPQESSDYYENNSGSYTLNIHTKTVNTDISNFLNNIIMPMKKIIFGYCRTSAKVSDNSLLSKFPSKLPESKCEKYGMSPQVDHTGKPMLDDKGNPINISVGWQPGLTQRMYNVLVQNSSYIHIVQASLVLMIVFYGFFFMTGMIRDVQSVVLKQVIRFSLVAVLIGENSWQFFNTYLFEMFINGIDSLIEIVAGNLMVVGGGSNGIAAGSIENNPFAFIDGTISTFFTKNAMIKILGLLGQIFVNPVSLIYFIVICVGMFYFVYAVIAAAVLYILCMLGLSLMMILGPIYIIFMLFEHTQHYFQRWFQMLFSFTLQPVFVFTSLALFNVFVYSALYTLLHYTVCWNPIVTISPQLLGGTLPDISTNLLSFDLLYFYAPEDFHSSPPKGLFVILIFIIIVQAMQKLVEYMPKLAAHIAVAADGTSLGAASLRVLNDFKGKAFDAAKYTAVNSGKNAISAGKSAAGAAGSAAANAAYQKGRRSGAAPPKS